MKIKKLHVIVVGSILVGLMVGALFGIPQAVSQCVPLPDNGGLIVGGGRLFFDPGDSAYGGAYSTCATPKGFVWGDAVCTAGMFMGHPTDFHSIDCPSGSTKYMSGGVDGNSAYQYYLCVKDTP